MRPFARALWFVVLCSLARGAQGSVAEELSIEGLTRAADLVLLGTVIAAQPEWSQDHRRILTRVRVEPAEVWKGGPPASAVAVLLPGGELDGLGQQIAGVPPVTAGERVVLFLRARGDSFRLVGLAQGLFHLVPARNGTGEQATRSLEGLALVRPEGAATPADGVGPWPLASLRTRVAAAVPAAAGR